MNLGKDTILKPNYRKPTAQYFHDLSTTFTYFKYIDCQHLHLILN